MDRIFNIQQSIIFLLLTVFVYITESVKTREINRNTRAGAFIGLTYLVEFDGEYRNTTCFLGIPFAKPPVGERRFAKPEPYGPITTLYNATFHRPHCMQTKATYEYLKIYEQSEDCLYLNIYIPGKTLKQQISYPVMIFIHGGSFVDGGADIYDGSKLSAFNDVIIVTINYRLNIFGFLSNGYNLKGNNGLWDMKLALQWVHNNIQDFGGDPSRVTLFGNSAGGAAVLYQAIHPDNRGLFQRVIAQSGSCFAFWAIQKKPVRNFRWFISDVGCDKGDHNEILTCLREKPAEELKLSENKYTTQFVPSVDLDFLPEDPISLSRKQTRAGKNAMDFFSELDLLTGVTSKDGAFALGYWEAGIAEADEFADIASGVSEKYFKEKYIPEIVSDMYDDIPKVLLESIKHQYTDWSKVKDPVSIRDRLMEFESDVTFFVPVTFTLKTHQTSQGNENSNNSYFYVFNYKPGFAPEPSWLTGATHVMELPYIFGFSKSLQRKLIYDYDAADPFIVSKEDLNFSKIMMAIWTNFAKTGNPNIMNGTSDFPTWPPFENINQQYLELTVNMTSECVKHHLAASRVAFWEHLVPVLTECSISRSSATFIFPLVSYIAEFFILCVFFISCY
ncbi:acetylcholinesterase-like [Mercenaria mercenaria]|uniref:acetylcholinesterase-like n=1 Tax=Mercenaria mercenaria TaxID=6596 RepID=UPI00234E9E35|nr:acetylcholinesterase-like [Mercenaria mercenaria]